MKTKLSKEIASIVASPVVATLTLWGRIKNFLDRGRWVRSYSLTPRYEGKGFFSLTLGGFDITAISDRHKDPDFGVPPTPKIPDVIRMPVPPFTDRTEVGPDGVNSEYSEYWYGVEAKASEVKPLILEWADKLTEVPKEIPWVFHHWASFNGPYGDYGGDSVASIKEGTTLEEIKSWASSLP